MTNTADDGDTHGCYSEKRVQEFRKFPKRPRYVQIGHIVAFTIVSGIAGTCLAFVPLGDPYSGRLADNASFIFFVCPLSFLMAGVWAMETISEFTDLPRTYHRPLKVGAVFGSMMIACNVASFYLGFFPTPFSTILYSIPLLCPAIYIMYRLIPASMRSRKIFQLRAKIVVASIFLSAN